MTTMRTRGTITTTITITATEPCKRTTRDGQIAKRHNQHPIQHAVPAFFLDHIRQHGSPMG